jgi:Zn-dependent protease
MFENLGEQILIFLRQLLVIIPGLYLGVVLHEVAHGYIAYRSGDPTAKNLGRLTLNPIAHIDLFGSILLPIMLILFRSGIIFGYAKPVPINPRYFRDYRRGIRYSALAGPATNLVIAFAIGAVYGLFVYILQVSGFSLGQVTDISFGHNVVLLINDMFQSAIYINIFLAIFNFIPVPPLDGSNILASFLPGDAMYKYMSIGRFGFIFIFILIFLGGRFFFGAISPVITFLFRIFTWWRYLM